ncbi:hypothetical protein RFI_35653, partial [Reticulomyxa filosa]
KNQKKKKKKKKKKKTTVVNIVGVVQWACKCNGSPSLIVKSCVRLHSIQNLENKGQSSVQMKLWIDNNVTTAQQSVKKMYNSSTIDFGGNTICWTFDTNSITQLGWRPRYAIQVTMTVNGIESQGSLTVAFPYNITSVFRSYSNQLLQRVNGNITFDIYHIFNAKFMKISNRNFMVYKKCYSLWSVCAEKGAQGTRLQCLANAVTATKPSNGEAALNDLKRGSLVLSSFQKGREGGKQKQRQNQ